jgi:hypothetical protein
MFVGVLNYGLKEGVDHFNYSCNLYALTVYVIEDSPYVCSCALYTNGGIEKEAVW